MAITLRLNEEQQKSVDDLKEFLNMKSSSKALIHAAEQHQALVKKIESEQSRIWALEYQLRELKESVTMYANAKERMLSLVNDD